MSAETDLRERFARRRPLGSTRTCASTRTAIRVLLARQPGRSASRALPAAGARRGRAVRRASSPISSGSSCPGITHWNHPRFFAYFAISAAPITIARRSARGGARRQRDAVAHLARGDRTRRRHARLACASCSACRRRLHGIIYDTASISGFTALAAARESLGLEIRERGMAGRADLPALRVYITEHTHSHIEKARDRARRRPRERRADSGRRRVSHAVRRARRARSTTTRRAACVRCARSRPSARRRRRRPIRSRRSRDVDARARACGCTSTRRTPGRRRSLPEFRWLLDGVRRAPIRSSSTRTSGCSSRSTSRCSTSRRSMLRRTFSLVADYLCDAAKSTW